MHGQQNIKICRQLLTSVPRSGQTIDHHQMRKMARNNCVRSLNSLICPSDPLIHPKQLFVTAYVFINHTLHGVQLTTGKLNGLTFPHIIHV